MHGSPFDITVEPLIYDVLILESASLTLSQSPTQTLSGDGPLAVADPGFPVGGGVCTRWGAWTSNVDTFW